MKGNFSSMRLHIHFGIHRTGTSSIHRNLSTNKNILLDNGILYPELGVESRHVKLAWKLINGKLSYEKAIEQIKAEIKDTTKLVLLSSEDFCLLDIEKWLMLLSENFDLSASIYLKRQDIWLESWYNQHIRWPWSKRFSNASPDFFLNKMSEFYWINYEQLLSRIASRIPEGKLYVNTVESSSVSDTANDLFQFLGVPLISKQVNKNASLSSAKMDIVRRINFINLNGSARMRIISALERLEIKEDNGSKHIFNDKQARLIMKKFSGSNKKVAEKYFGREKLFNDPYISHRSPSFVSDEKAYKKYIPELLKIVSQDS